MFNLIKKDFLIVKKMWIIVMALAFMIPIFISFIGENVVLPSGLIISIVSILLGTMLLSSIFEEEEKYPKASALITTIGYSRKIQIGSRYILGIGIFLWCFLGYLLESFFIKSLGNITVLDFVLALFSFGIIVSLYLSLTIKYGIKLSRYIVMGVILLISLGPAITSRLNIHIDLSILKDLNENVLIAVLLMGTVIIYMVSLKVSLFSYSTKEL